MTGNSRAGFLAGRAVYNLGRLLTYCLLGLIFGLMGKTLLLAGIQRWVSIGLGVILLVGLASSKTLALSRPVIALVSRLKADMSIFLHRRSLFALATFGMLNGLLPCGLVYVACAGATTASSAFSGIQYMAAFGVGTLPMMLGIGLSGRLVPLALRLQLRKAIPASVALLAALLILRGMSLGIPYLSPNLSADGASCCQK
jgi:sulfite exporter TauE/SafE